MPTTRLSREAPALHAGHNRTDMLSALRVIGNMLQRRRVPLSVRGARGLGFLITFVAHMLRDDPNASLPADPE